MLPSGQNIAHYNVARLRAMPGDPLVAEFVDNVPKVNALAERSPGFVWRLNDNSAQVSCDVSFQAVVGDPLIAASLSVWESVEALAFFVKKTVHGAFLRRREAWFEPWNGPNYVIWPVPIGHLPTVEEGQQRLSVLARDGASDDAFDFAYAASHPGGSE
ncbi:MAG TPA: DUF3291 domain-containing protein [Albidovulum sp.]|uniref:DUF3291 domain-containing protein n=1 Tax=Albidovulum sp. TaxID=1872424 RepID=UPI002CD4F268|nr:DUF3291 domain-containing protein [Albidovulum sp.]